MTRENHLQGIKKDIIKIKAACFALLDYSDSLRRIINLNPEAYCSPDEMEDTMKILQMFYDAISRPEAADALCDKLVSSETAKTPCNKYRYYLTERPLQLGAFPQPADNKPASVCPFKRKIKHDMMGKEVFGFVEYDKPLTPDQIYQYELTACGK